ncbi:hypothetical protein C8R43DRAFT_247667 [Mycena crocata]|nr:hypothetical protein C8R43DRAFT_247667 [Mycena crocata]
MVSDGPPPKTVVVLGASYGGARAAHLIAAGLPAGWRIVLVDRNSHVNHVYILPRLAVLAGHEHKAFVPTDNIFNVSTDTPAEHMFLHTHVEGLSAHSVKLARAFPEHGIPTDELHFDYAIYALGSHLPGPLSLWGTPSERVHQYGGTKVEAIAWLKGKQRAIEEAASVLVVGGGALGIQFATDIAAIHPDKAVTLLHSRTRLLPRFDHAMHTEILQALESSDVDVVLGERLDLSTVTDSDPDGKLRQRTVRTTTGREINADLVLLCTGQRPNTELLTGVDARTVDSGTALAHVLRTMQLGMLPSSPPTPASSVPSSSSSADSGDITSLEEALARIALQAEASVADDDTSEDAEETTPYPHIFVVGDAADAFGAVPAGHNAYYQAEVAARNLLRLVRVESGTAATGEARGADDDELEWYTPGPPAIKVSLGLHKNAYQVNGVVGVGKETRDDLNAAAMWGYFGCPVEDPDGEEMLR